MGSKGCIIQFMHMNNSLYFICAFCFYFQVKLRNDMPDDMLRDAIETSRRVLDTCDFEAEGI